MKQEQSQIFQKGDVVRILLDYFKQPKLVKFLSTSDFIDLYTITFYKCVKNFDKEKHTDFSTYYYRSVVNTALKILKKRKEIPFSQLDETELVKLFPTYETEESIKLDIDNILQKAKLTEHQLKLLDMHFRQCLSYREIGDKLNLTGGGVGYHMQRIIDRLKEVAHVKTESFV